jgi:predicted patatin/cPLA2 family phospholipase
MTGLVLEGGALRTIYSSGVCDGLLEAGAPMPDYIVGVSAGIAYGVSYISKQEKRNLQILMRYVHDKRYMGAGNLLDRDNRSYFGLKFVYETIPNQLIPFDYETYAAFPGKVEAVVTNLETGRADYLEVPKRDEHFTMLQATCAMPLLFPVYEINGSPYLDGGVADGIPYQRAFDIGCDKVVAILTRERTYRRKRDKVQRLIDHHYKQYPKFCDTMRHRAEVYNQCREKLFQLEREGKAMLFTPKSTKGFSRVERDVVKIHALWDEGYQEGIRRAEEFAAFLQT